MKFSEKVRQARREKGWTQQELAEALRLSVRTVGSYESGNSYPKSRLIYDRLATLFNRDRNYFLVEEDQEDPYRAKAAEPEEEAERLIHQANSLFAGGRLSEEDKDAVMRALQEAYWDARKEQDHAD